MKKVLRFLGILLLIIVAGVVVLGLIAPKDIKVERTVTINGPKEVVAEQLLQFKNFNNWNPWAELDSNMKSGVEGDENAFGGKYFWEGNKDVGKGEMVTKEIKGMEKYFTTYFKKPWESTSDGYLKVEDAGNGQTKAIWGFTSHASFPMNGMMMVMGMGDMIGKDFDKGLTKLKKLVESGKVGLTAAGGVNIKETEFAAHTYAAVRKTIGMKEVEKFLHETYTMLGNEAGARISGPASAVYYMWDEKTQKTEVAAGFPVSGAESVKGAEMINIPQSKAYMVVLKGGYSGMYKVHQALGEHVAKTGKNMGNVIEEYIVSPAQEKDSTKWVTNIYYLYQ